MKHRLIIMIMLAVVVSMLGCDKKEQKDYVPDIIVGNESTILDKYVIRVKLSQGADDYVISETRGILDGIFDREPVDSFTVVGDTLLVKMLYHDNEVLRVERADTSTYHVVLSPMDTTLFKENVSASVAICSDGCDPAVLYVLAKH